MTQHVSTNDTNFPRWIRSAAIAINSLIGGLTTADDSIATLNSEVAVLQAPTIIKFTPLASAPASPGEGWAYYDGTLHKLRVWDGTAWQACW